MRLWVGLLAAGCLLAGILIGSVSLTPTQAQSLPWTPTATVPPPATATATPVPRAPTDLPTPVPLATTVQDLTPLVDTVRTLDATATPTRTPLPPGFAPDRCAPNFTLLQPCALPTEVDHDLNFLGSTRDVVSFYLKGGRVYVIRATSTSGIDPQITVWAAGALDAVPLAQADDVAPGDVSAQVEIPATTDMWVIVAIDNRAPGDMTGRTYTLSARSQATSSLPVPTASVADDPVGNAYSPDTAARIAWNTPYDLTMQCPDPRPGACYSGRHTFLRVPVKASVALMVITYDLGSAVDTVVSVYQPDGTQTRTDPGQFAGWRLVASNDDILPGWTLRSQVTLAPTWTGEALVVIAPSTRQDIPRTPDDRSIRYRLIVGAPNLPNVQAVLRQQTDLPATPTLLPTADAAPPPVAPTAAPDAREVVREACATGLAFVVNPTALYGAAPPADGDELARYGADAPITLLGQCYRGWVKVQPADSVTPGWMWGPHLRPLVRADATPTPPERESGIPTPTASPGGAEPDASAPTAAPVPTGQPVPTLVVLPPAPPLPAPTSRPQGRTITIEVCRPAADGRGCATPLPEVVVEVLGVANGQVLTSGRTDATGRVTLSVSVAANTALLVRLPAVGVQAALPDSVVTLPIRVTGYTGGTP